MRGQLWSGMARHRQLVAMAAACAVVALVMFVLYRDLRHDDAYITFQYARNVAEGHGFVFNEGERVLGTTTPLFTLLMALVTLVGGDVAQWAVAISTLAVAAQGFMFWLLLRTRAPVCGWAIAIAVSLGGGGIWSNLALETSLYAALVFATIVCTSRERDIAAGVLLGLAFLTRYDAAVLVVAVAGWRLVERRQLPWRLLVTSLVCVLPWLVFAQVYFGSVFPHTLGAKTAITSSGAYVGHYAQLAISPFWGLDVAWIGPAAALLCAVLGVRWFVRESRPIVVLLVYGLLHTAVYAWIGPFAEQHWHMYVPVLLARVLLIIGALGAIEVRAATSTGTRRRACYAAVALGGVVVVTTTVLALRTHAAGYRTAFWLGTRHHRYEEVSRWIEEHIRADASVFASEVGTIGYLTRRRMIDPFGLITDTNDWPRTKRAADKAALIARYKPDVALVDSEQESAQIRAIMAYELVHVFGWRGPWSRVLVRDRAVLVSP